jgi:hypothetical protein
MIPTRRDLAREVQTLRDQLASQAARHTEALAIAEHQRQLLADELSAMHHPPIFFNTLPKSGSVYILTTLQRGLGTRVTKLARGTFPHDMLNGAALHAFAKGNAIGQEHLDASTYNLTLLARHLGRWCVHLRDPRAAAFSWMHHLTKLMRQTPTHEHQHALLLPDPAYADASLEDRMTWIVEHHFPACITWMTDWIAVAPAPGSGGAGVWPAERPARIHLCTYEHFVADADAFFAELLEFFNVAPERFRRRLVERSEAVNFRKAQTDEWRQCGDALTQRMTDRMPNAWFDRFGWTR